VSAVPEETYNPEVLIGLSGGDSDSLLPVDAGSMCPLPEGLGEPLVHELIFSMLLWESTMENAVRAMGRIHEQFVDYNELRVCFPDEIEGLLGSRYQRAEDRSVRLVGALRKIFETNHRLSLEHLRGMSKREARDYLDTFEMLPRFVVSRVMLLGLDAHAFPVDAKITRALHKAELIKGSKNPDTIATTLERSIRANQTLDTYTRLERWLVQFESGS
jgi:endonuclease III